VLFREAFFHPLKEGLRIRVDFVDLPTERTFQKGSIFLFSDNYFHQRPRKLTASNTVFNNIRMSNHKDQFFM